MSKNYDFGRIVDEFARYGVTVEDIATYASAPGAVYIRLVEDETCGRVIDQFGIMATINDCLMVLGYDEADEPLGYNCMEDGRGYWWMPVEAPFWDDESFNWIFPDTDETAYRPSVSVQTDQGEPV